MSVRGIKVLHYASELVPGYHTYRIYGHTTHANEVIYKVSGNETNSFNINLGVNNTVYNSEFGALVGSDINPAFIPFFPDLAADSFVTIGIDSQNVGDQTAISIQTDNGISIYENFLASGATTNNMDSGGYEHSWYVPKEAINAKPNSDGDVLLAQITSSSTSNVPSSISGTFNVHFYNTLTEVETVETISFSDDSQFISGTTLLFSSGGNNAPQDISGCTDSTAFNYDPTATIDDGSCIPVVNGCTDSTAFNYDAAANTDDGTCKAKVYGCTDPKMANYNAAANTDDGSCVYINENGEAPNFADYSAGKLSLVYLRG